MEFKSLKYQELENFLEYLNDKVEDVYRAETTNAIKEFLQDCITSKGEVKND